MAWSFSIIASSGDRTGCTQIGPNLYLVEGLWDADTDGIGDIVTGLGHVIAYNVEQYEVVAEEPLVRKNILSADFTTVAEGTIAVNAVTADNYGSWWAICQK